MASRVQWTLSAVLAGALLSFGVTAHAEAQWRDTEVPPSLNSPATQTVTYDAEARLADPIGLREPFPEHRGRRLRITGGVLLALVGVVIGGTFLSIANQTECSHDECEGSAAAVIIPSALASLFTVTGIALLVAGRASRFPRRGHVRISVGASRGVPTLTAQF